MAQKRNKKNKVITKENFIEKLLSIWESKKNILPESYSNFFKRAFRALDDDDIKKLKFLEINDDFLNDLKFLKRNYSCFKKGENIKKCWNIYNNFWKNKKNYWLIVKKYSDYHIAPFIEEVEIKVKEKTVYTGECLKLKEEMDEKFGLLEKKIRNGVKKKNKKSSKNTVKNAVKIKKVMKKTNSLRENNSYLITDLIDRFPKNINEINIYIDEVWALTGESQVSETIKAKNTGAIAGVIYFGNKPDYKSLEKIKNHLRRSGKEAFEILISNEKVIPFFMPISIKEGLIASSYYLELLQVAVKIILGWVLPQTGNSIKVNIYPEHIGNFVDETDRTQFFQGVFENLKLTTNRFGRFSINKVIWKDKNYEYIPYADLVGYIGLQHVEFSRKLLKKIPFDDVVVNIPISIDTYRRLERLDKFESSKDIKNIIELLIEFRNNKLSNYIYNLLEREFKKDDDLKVAAIDLIESYYLNKIRDMEKLRILYYYFNKLIETIDVSKLLYKTQIQIILIKIQQVNHEGNFKLFDDLLKNYNSIKEKSKKDNQGLVFYTDLNFIVSLNDQFRFKDSFKLIDNLVNNFDFSFYSNENSAKALSTYGQILSLMKNYEKADSYFINAIQYFKEADLLNLRKQKEIEQTTIYRIINMINNNNREAVSEFKKFLSENKISLKDIAGDKTSKYQYLHYTIAKLIYFFNNVDMKLEYISYISDFYKNQHPYEVILLYKALFLAEDFDLNKNRVKLLFDNAVNITKVESHGSVIKLIGSVILLIAMIYYPNDENYQNLFNSYTKTVRKDMPNAIAYINKIEKYAEKSDKNDIKDILKILPFNYI